MRRLPAGVTGLIAAPPTHCAHSRQEQSDSCIAAPVKLRSMPDYRLQVTIPMVSGIPEDSVTNVWHCSADSLSAAVFFFNAVNTFYAAIDGLYSNLVATTGSTMKLYDLADDMPRAPVHEGTLGTLSVGGNPLPTEVALVMSFQGSRVSGLPQAIRRGRVYIGPIQDASNHTDGRPTSSAVSGLVSAGDALVTSSKGASDWKWCVFSRSTNSMVVVDNGWVDNEWDTQRRRGRDATSRSTFA